MLADNNIAVVPLGGKLKLINLGPEELTVPFVISATGRIWMDRNLGASQVATAVDDALAYGDLYQWGRAADGHEKRTSGTTTTLSSTENPGHSKLSDISPYDWTSPQNNNLWQGVSGINNPCPDGFRLPSKDEWQAEVAAYGSTFEDLFDSPLQLPAAGSRHHNFAQLNAADHEGAYWANTLENNNAFAVVFGAIPTSALSLFRAYGCSVRCIMDN